MRNTKKNRNCSLSARSNLWIQLKGRWIKFQVINPRILSTMRTERFLNFPWTKKRSWFSICGSESDSMNIWDISSDLKQRRQQILVTWIFFLLTIQFPRRLLLNESFLEAASFDNYQLYMIEVSDVEMKRSCFAFHKYIISIALWVIASMHLRAFEFLTQKNSRWIWRMEGYEWRYFVYFYPPQRNQIAIKRIRIEQTISPNQLRKSFWETELPSEF